MQQQQTLAREDNPSDFQSCQNIFGWMSGSPRHAIKKCKTNYVIIDGRLEEVSIKDHVERANGHEK